MADMGTSFDWGYPPWSLGGIPAASGDARPEWGKVRSRFRGPAEAVGRPSGDAGGMRTARVLARSPAAPALSSRRRIVVAMLELFLGIGALYGGISLLVDAEGFGMKESWLDGSPFADYLIPGLFLLVVIGGGMLVAAALALAGSSRAAPAAL